MFDLKKNSFLFKIIAVIKRTEHQLVEHRVRL